MMSVGSHGGSNGVVRDANWDLPDLVDWSVDGLADGLDGVGPGLVGDGLGDGLVGPDWAMDLLGAEGWDVLEDGLGNVVGLDDGGGLVGVDGGGDVGVGGLSHGVGQGGDLGHHLGEGVSLSSGVGKVTAQPVVLDGGGVVSWSSHQVGNTGQGQGSRGHAHGGSAAKSDQSGEEQEGLE
jgi:hypothetical protein